MMKKNYLFLILLLPILAFSQGKSFWSKTDDSKIQQENLLKRNSTPVAYDLFALDINAMKEVLADAPDRDLNIQSEIVVQFPTNNGKMETFEVYNASIMERNFAANYPDIQSYVAVSRENTGTIIRFSTTVFGFHAIVQTIGKTLYIDPYTNDLRTYVLYAKQHLYANNLEERMGCLVDDAVENRTSTDTSFTPENANDGVLRTFRLALACTQEYANYHINAAGQAAATDAVKRATVLAAMNVTMTRVNSVFERDLSLTMTLVDNTSIIFLAEDDGLTDDDPLALINTEIQGVIDTNIGSPNYDIGHVFTTGGGGIAAFGGICYSSLKARGITGSPNPIGDPFDIDFVSHEMGHQFGANHTFNGGQENCSGTNRNGSTAIEPGSGTTIMGYAGICGSDNVQPNSDDHFHAVSIDQIWTRITPPGEPTCSTNTANGNTAPVVNAGANYTIPYGTAFTLSGTASDANGTTLSYCWEQVDPGTTTNVPNTTSTTDPQFRSYSPVATGDRTFPQLSDILNDNLTPAWEVIPNVARTMDFALTVRDNGSPNGGQTNRGDMSVTLANTGPFIVTAPNTTNQSFPAGSATTITWDVAGTTANGINTANVNILLSTDGGQTFPTTLAASTANDGSESITFPIVFEPYCRIKIEAVGNIFFAISKSISVGATVTQNTTCNTYTTGPIATAIPDGIGANQQGNTVGVPLTVSETTAITDIRVSTDITHAYIGDLYLRLQSPNAGPFADFWIRSCNNAQFGNIDATFIDGAAAITCASPTMGTFDPPANSLLATLGGLNPSGIWNLVAADFFNGDAGVINEFSIELCTTTTTVVLSNEEFALQNFSLYPNPNKGEFSLAFSSESGKNIDINVYDISGRLVHTKNYNATSTFNENISLKNVSSGMYLITVTDQDKTVTKKLIIE